MVSYGAELAKEIRAAIKTLGYKTGGKNADVTVRKRSSYSFQITQKNPDLALQELAMIELTVKNFQSIDRCEYSGEILSGANTYIFVYGLDGYSKSFVAEHDTERKRLEDEKWDRDYRAKVNAEKAEVTENAAIAQDAIEFETEEELVQYLLDVDLCLGKKYYATDAAKKVFEIVAELKAEETQEPTTTTTTTTDRHKLNGLTVQALPTKLHPETGIYNTYLTDLSEKRAVEVLVYQSINYPEFSRITVMVKKTQFSGRTMGKDFKTWEEALNNYKSPKMIAVLAAIQEVHTVKKQ
ncbi:MAG: hypothetical protein AAFO96_03490 [Bacteroidota bacterium]